MIKEPVETIIVCRDHSRWWVGTRAEAVRGVGLSRGQVKQDRHIKQNRKYKENHTKHRKEAF